MEFSIAELVDLVETIGTRQTYLRKMTEPEMGLQQQLVEDARAELYRLDLLRSRFLQEIIRVKG